MSTPEFLKRPFGDLSDMIADEDHLRAVWSEPDNRESFMERLEDHGYDRGRLNDIRQLVDAPDSDLFDVFGYVLFEHPPRRGRLAALSPPCLLPSRLREGPGEGRPRRPDPMRSEMP